MKSAINGIKGIFILLLLLFIFLSFRSFSYSKTETPGIPLGAEPHDIAINPETDTAVITLKGDGHHHSESGYASVVDLATQTVISEVPVGRKPTAVAIDNELNIALVGNSKDDTLSVIDLNSLEVTATIATGRSPEGIAVNPLTHIALVANHKDDTVSVIDLMTYEVIATVPVGREPIDVAIDPELNIALVVNEKGDKHKHEKDKDYTVSVIDLATYEVTGEIRVGRKPQAVDINPETHLSVVANEKDSSITVIDLLNYQTDSVAVCKHPVDAAINPLNNCALVLCDGERVLQLIDLDTSSIVKEYSINKKSEAVAVNPYTNIAGVVDEKTDSLTLIQLPNPVPEIASITPETILRGSSATKITVAGSGFLKSSVVTLLTPNSYTLNSVFIDNHTLEVEVPEALLQKTGIYEITATNPEPEGGESNALELTVENPIPSITVLAPAEAVAGTGSLTVNVYGTGFFYDTAVYINGTSRTFTLLSPTQVQLQLTASDLDAGGYLEITTSNPSPGGGTSGAAVFTVLNPVPALSSIAPATVTAGSPDFTLTLTGNNFVKTSIVSFNGEQYDTTYISSTQLKATIPADAIQTAGEYPVKVINPAPGGGESSPLTFTVKPPLEIYITIPSDGDTINKEKVIVKGTFKSNTQDIGITVNGIIAEVIGNEWIANDVPLTVGQNTITATITDSEGNTASTSIIINTTDTSQPVELTANITSGIPPLQVFFSASTSFIPVSYQMDFEGDGIIDYTGATFENINHTYTTEGIFYPTVIITDEQGNTYSDTIAITMLNKTEIDVLLRAKWEGMKMVLKEKNIEKALESFTERAKKMYQYNFTLMSSILPQIVQDMGDIKLVEIRDNLAEYEMLVIQDGEEHSFYLEFIKEVDGLWKINFF